MNVQLGHLRPLLDLPDVKAAHKIESHLLTLHYYRERKQSHKVEMETCMTSTRKAKAVPSDTYFRKTQRTVEQKSVVRLYYS